MEVISIERSKCPPHGEHLLVTNKQNNIMKNETNSI